MTDQLRVALLTREFPPDVYGGAGVHVEYLARELDRLVDLTVHCFGADRPARRSRISHGSCCVGTPRWKRYRSTWRWPRPARPSSCTATPGTRISAATWRSSGMGFRTSRPCTASSRCGRGRPSSSAAATRSIVVRADGARGRRRGDRRFRRAPPRPARPSTAAAARGCARSQRAESHGGALPGGRRDSRTRRAVHELGLGGRGGHRQVDRYRFQRSVPTQQLQPLTRDRAGPVGAEAVDGQVDQDRARVRGTRRGRPRRRTRPADSRVSSATRSRSGIHADALADHDDPSLGDDEALTVAIQVDADLSSPPMRTFLSRIALRTTAWRAMSTPCITTERSTSA